MAPVEALRGAALRREIGAVSKAVDRVLPVRGFESHPLRCELVIALSITSG
jgi:hypothetical protein